MALSDYFSGLDHTGVVPILGYPGLNIEGATVRECLLNPKLHARIIRKVHDHYRPDAALPLLDLTVEAECYGLKAEFPRQEPPQLRATIPLKSWVDEKPDGSRIPLMIETAQLMSDQITDLPVGFYVTGPFTLAGQVVGIQNLFIGLIKDREKTLNLVNSCTATIVDYTKQLKEAGLDFLVIADPTPSLLSPKQFNDFAKTPIANVVKTFSGDSILHICGRSGHLLKQMAETGATGVSIDENVKLATATSTLPSSMVILGNYSPTKLAFETPDNIRTDVKQMLSNVSEGKVVASTGCDISASTPEINIHTFIQTVKSYAKAN